jgi:hypothetical protein
MTPQTQSQAPTQRRGTLEATSRAAEAADQAVHQDAVSSVVWERRGFLRVLRRVTRPSHPGSDLD